MPLDLVAVRSHSLGSDVQQQQAGAHAKSVEVPLSNKAIGSLHDFAKGYNNHPKCIREE